MVHSLSCLTHAISLVSRSVKLPTRQSAAVTHLGHVKISADFILSNVLCVPTFGFNLLSVSQLTRDLGCHVSFFADFCYIQDPCSRRMIGLAEQHDGLYHLKSHFDNCNVAASNNCSSSFSTCCNVSSHNLWHYRLGHLPFSMLKVLQTSNSDVTFSDFSPCEICPLAKQRKLSFPLRQHVSQHPFDLIH